MKKHSLKDWLIAVRPWSFPASAMPVIVTLAYLYWAYGVIEWANGLLALAGIVIFHASGNAWSDYFDFERGVDRVDTFGVKTLTSGQFMPLEIRNLAIGLMVPGGDGRSLAGSPYGASFVVDRCLWSFVFVALSVAEISGFRRFRYFCSLCHTSYFGYILYYYGEIPA